MKKDESYTSSLQFLQSIRKQIDNLSTNPNNAPAICRLLSDRVKNNDHIGIIVALYNKKYLQNLLKTLQALYIQKKDIEIQKSISVLYVYAYECFFKHIPQLNPFFEYFKLKISKIVDKKTYKDFSAEDKRYQAMRALLIQFASSSNINKQPFQRGKDINEFISQQLNKTQPKTVFQECVYTYIRMQIQEIQGNIVNELQKQQIGFCCKLHFEQGGSKINVQTKNQNFNKELPSLPSKKILKEQSDPKQIKKHIVSYLNSTGGIYYFGIEHKLQKQAIFHGLVINQKDKFEILSWVLNEVVMKIYPPDEQNEDQDEKQQQQRMQQWRRNKIDTFSKIKFDFSQQYEINKYIFVDFINLYNPDTWFYSRKEELKYIVRIKVKLGDEYELYHIVNDKDIPQAYLRSDKKEKKLNVVQYYNEVYRRFKNKANNRSDNPPQMHSFCRFPFKEVSKK